MNEAAGGGGPEQSSGVSAVGGFQVEAVDKERASGRETKPHGVSRLSREAGTPDRTRGWEEPERECSTRFQPALATPNQASSPYKSHFSLFKLCMVEIISD